MADAKIQPTAVPAQPLTKPAGTTAEEATTTPAATRKWPASTTLSDLKKSTFCALFERNCL